MRVYQRIRAARSNPEHDLLDDGDAVISIVPSMNSRPVDAEREIPPTPPAAQSAEDAKSHAPQ